LAGRRRDEFLYIPPDGPRKPIQVTEKIPNLIYMTTFVAPYPAVTRHFLSMSFWTVPNLSPLPLRTFLIFSYTVHSPSLQEIPHLNTIERTQNPSQDTSTEENGRNSNFRSGSEDFTALGVGVVSLMTRDSGGDQHVAFVWVSCCTAIYDGACVNIAILSNSSEGDCQYESENPER
jgi:hypothetical protein